MSRPYLVLDVETVAVDGVDEFLDVPSAPANYKDPEKIAAYVADARQKAIDSAATDVALARPIVVCKLEPDGVLTTWTPTSADDERECLIDLWSEWERDPIVVGFHVLAYDLPLLLLRSMELGIGRPAIKLGKYSHPDVIDLGAVLTFDYAVKLHSLGFYCRRFGVPHDDSFRGEDVARAWREGRLSEIRKHCEEDVRSTLALAKTLGVL